MVFSSGGAVPTKCNMNDVSWRPYCLDYLCAEILVGKGPKQSAEPLLVSQESKQGWYVCLYELAQPFLLFRGKTQQWEGSLLLTALPQTCNTMLRWCVYNLLLCLLPYPSVVLNRVQKNLQHMACTKSGSKRGTTGFAPRESTCV